MPKSAQAAKATEEEIKALQAGVTSLEPQVFVCSGCSAFCIAAARRVFSTSDVQIVSCDVREVATTERIDAGPGAEANITGTLPILFVR